jgi:hypothetical protein
MVHWSKVEEQLERIGCNFQYWGRSEARELCNVLLDDEKIAHCVNGQYQNGFAMLVATDHRVLLIDKKPMKYLNVVDIRFELITEFDYGHRLMNATARICTPTKVLSFTSWNQHRLRALINYVQHRVIEIRQHQHLAQQFQQRAIELMEFTRKRQAYHDQQPTYVPNLAGQDSGGMKQADAADEPADTLGALTYTKLPHFRRRNSQRLGQFAVIPSHKQDSETAVSGDLVGEAG